MFYWSYREDGREREILMWERNINWLPPIHALTGDRTHILGMCPDRESNLQPFTVRNNAATKWATWPGQESQNLKYHGIISVFHMKSENL